VRRVPLNVTLYVVVMVAAALLVVAAVRVLQDDPAPASLPVQGVVELREGSAAEQQRYADIIDAASAEATAMINISYSDVQSAIDKVLAGATGDFKDQYTAATDALIKLFQDNQSVRKGQVLWAGVVAQDPDSATVILATTGTVATKKSPEKAENYRIQMQLVSEKGRWLTSDLQFVT
jgi:Mce-associated membrane protein